jgi:hypothetical protein
MHESYRIVCWFGCQYIFEILGIDIGVIGDRGPGKYHQFPHREKNKLIKKVRIKSWHQHLAIRPPSKICQWYRPPLSSPRQHGIQDLIWNHFCFSSVHAFLARKDYVDTKKCLLPCHAMQSSLILPYVLRKGSSVRNSSKRFCLSFQPFHSYGVWTEKVLRLGVDVGMILVQPVFLSPREEVLINQFPAVRNHCHMLKA